MAGIRVAKYEDLEGFVDEKYVDDEIRETQEAIAVVDAKISQKADEDHTHSYDDIADTPSIPDVSGLESSVDQLAKVVNEKADKSELKTLASNKDLDKKAETSDVYSKSEVDNLVADLRSKIDALQPDEEDSEE